MAQYQRQNYQTQNSGQSGGGYGSENDNLRKVFVGGLHSQSTRDTVRAFYEQFGAVSDVHVMVDPQTKKSRGFAFVTFETEEGVDAAQANRPHVIDGKQADCKRAIPRDDQSPEARMATQKIFVGGLRREITQEQLQEYFGQFGNLTECLLMKDKATGGSKGYGFLTFDDTDTVDKVILHRPHSIANSRADVKKALSKDEMAQIRGRQEQQASNGGGGYQQQKSGEYGGGYQTSDYGGGYGGSAQRGGYGDSAQRGSYGDSVQRGGYGDSAQRGGYGNSSQRGGYGGSSQGGGYGGSSQMGGYGNGYQAAEGYEGNGYGAQAPSGNYRAPAPANGGARPGGAERSYSYQQQRPPPYGQAPQAQGRR